MDEIKNKIKILSIQFPLNINDKHDFQFKGTVGKTTALKKWNFTKITDLYSPEPYNCTEEKQTLQQWTGEKDYYNKEKQILQQ